MFGGICRNLLCRFWSNELTWSCVHMFCSKHVVAGVCEIPEFVRHVSFETRLMPQTTTYEIVQRAVRRLSGAGGSIARRWELPKRCATELCSRMDLVLPVLSGCNWVLASDGLQVITVKISYALHEQCETGKQIKSGRRPGRRAAVEGRTRMASLRRWRCLKHATRLSE